MRYVRVLITTLVVVGFLSYAGYKVIHNPEWHNFDWRKLLASVSQIRLPEMLGAALLMYLTYFLRACRWHEFLRPVKDTSIRGLTVAMILGFGAVAVLGRPGDFVRPYMVAKREGMTISSQMAVWVLERFFDTVAMILVVGVAFLVGAGVGDDTGPASPVLMGMRKAGITLLVATVIGVVLLVLYERHLGHSESQVSWMPAKLRTGLANFARGLACVRSARAITLTALYSLAIWVSIASAYWMVLQAFGPPLDDLSFAASMLVMGFSIAGSVVQAPGVGGGSQVLAILALTEIYGVGTEIATSAGIVLWALAFWAVVPLAVVLCVRLGISWREMKSMTHPNKEQLA